MSEKGREDMNIRRRRYGTFIYLAAAFWLLIIGICLDFEQAYSFSASYNMTEPKHDAITSVSQIISEELCTEELLGHRIVLKGKSGYQNSEMRRHPEFRDVCLPLRGWLLPACPAYQAVSSNLLQKLYSHTVIMNYIHNKDGKKSRTVLQNRESA